MTNRESQPVSLDEFLQRNDQAAITRVTVRRPHFIASVALIKGEPKIMRKEIGGDTRTIVLPPSKDQGVT